MSTQSKKLHCRIFCMLNADYSDTHPENDAILMKCKGLCWVVSSAAEAETHGVFHNFTIALNIRNILTHMGHPQPMTPVQTDNSTTNSFVNKNIQFKKSKSWDMHLHWLSDKEVQKQLQVYWKNRKITGQITLQKLTSPLYIINRFVIIISKMR